MGLNRYQMGIVPKLAWGWWALDAIADPFIGSPQTSRHWSFWAHYKKNKDLTGAYEAAKARFFINVGGYDTWNGQFVPWDEKHSFKTLKQAVAPGVATLADYLLSRLTGRATRRLRLPGLGQMLGSK